MYLLEGVGEMHQRYDLKVGDVMIFAHLPDSTLVVGGRPMTEVRMRKFSIPGVRMCDFRNLGIGLYVIQLCRLICYARHLCGGSTVVLQA